jgi:hypothetical protein
MRKTLRTAAAVAVAAALWIAGPSAATAHDGRMHRAVYKQTRGPQWMPERVVIRCPGWAEDVANRLTLVEFDRDRVVYRCDLTV